MDELSGDLPCALETLERPRAETVLEAAIRRYLPLRAFEGGSGRGLHPAGQPWGDSRAGAPEVLLAIREVVEGWGRCPLDGKE